MPDLILRKRARIRQAIDFLAVNRRPITVRIKEEQTLFDSMIVKVDHGDPVSEAGRPGTVIIQWLSPPKGNNLIQNLLWLLFLDEVEIGGFLSLRVS